MMCANISHFTDGKSKLSRQALCKGDMPSCSDKVYMTVCSTKRSILARNTKL